MILDYETRSEADLKAVGAYEYARHPSTKILCVAWALGTKEELREPRVWSWAPGLDPKLPESFLAAIHDPSVKIVAHNAFFEQVITWFVLLKNKKNPSPLENTIARWRCTAAQAAALALPRDLAGATAALGLAHQKDQDGHRLMLKISKPRKPTKNDPSVWHNKISDLKRLVEYCVADIRAETDLFLTTPELSEAEQKIWELDQKINWRGFKVDLPFVEAALDTIALESDRLLTEIKDLTGGAIESTNQRAKTLEWCSTNGAALPNLQAGTIAEALANDLCEEPARTLLTIRQSLSKTSTAKFESMKARAGVDSRIRDALLYHGASTGRWSGRGVQPHNFPRGNLKPAEVELAIDLLKTGGGPEMLRLFLGEPLSVLSSSLRGAIISENHRELFCADFNAIEARVLFWLAKHVDGVAAYKKNVDLYRQLAAVIFNKPESEITANERDVGKRAILGCGYGMGWKKFLATCHQYGAKYVTEAIAQMAVGAYREKHFPVVAMWGAIERAAIWAVQDPKRKFTNNSTTWWVQNNFLWCKLPSGRRLAYYGPTIRYEPTPWGEQRPKLYHWGVDQKTNQWVNSATYGGRLVENVVQAVARDFMAESMSRLERNNYEILLTVHDEILAERTGGSLEEFETEMNRLPDWGLTCPIKASGWKGLRYRK